MPELRNAQNTVDVAAMLMRAEFASLHIYRSDRRALELIAHKGFDEISAATWKWVYPETATACGLSVRLRRQIIIRDVSLDKLLEASGRDAYLACNIQATQSTPLLDEGTGTVLGVISTHWRRPHLPTKRKLQMFNAWVDQTTHLMAVWNRAMQLMHDADAQVKRSQGLVARSQHLIAAAESASPPRLH
jgi:GAF domain-containing protein